MKAHTGFWIEQFEFTDEDRQTLLTAWSRQRDRDLADAFILRAEQSIALWKSDPAMEMEEASVGDMRDRAQRVSRAAKELSLALDGADEDFGTSLQMVFREITTIGRPAAEIRRMADAWGALAGMDTRGKMEENPATPGLDSVSTPLLWMLDRLAESADRIEEEVKPQRGPNRNREKALVFWLAEKYHRTFGKLPSKTDNGNFQKFMALLAPILEIKVSPHTVRAVLESM